MGQGTMTLKEAAAVSKVTTKKLAREAFEGRLTLHQLPRCPVCEEDGPCKPSCKNAGTQIVWLGDWFAWQSAGPEKCSEPADPMNVYDDTIFRASGPVGFRWGAE